MIFSRNQLIFLIVAWMLCTPQVQAATLSKSSITKPDFSQTRWTTCIDKNLGYKIKCSPDWFLETKPESIMFLVKGEPRNIVTVTVSKINQPFKFQDLTPRAMQSLFRYADNFFMAKTRVADQPALVVRASPENFPDFRLLDYLVVRNNELYRISFAVSSKERFSAYKSFFADLIKSFQFFKTEENSLSFANKKEPLPR